MVKKQKPRKKVQHSKTSYIVIGLIFVFLSSIAFFKWGFIGIIYTNIFRFIVGEAYPLLLILFGYIGLKMIVSSSLLNLSIKVIIGTILIFTALTTSLHYNEFFPQEPLVEDIVSTTYSIFVNEFMTGQVKVSLGGGMLGALTYKTFGYLFGRWGTYLLSVFLFMIGLFLVENFTLNQLKDSVKSIRQKSIKLISKVSNLKRSFNEVKSFDSESVNNDIDEIDSEKIESISSNKVTPSLINKLSNIFGETTEVNFESNNDDNLLANEFNHSYRPSLKDVKQSQWESFQRKDPLASTAKKVRRFSTEDKVLDLDYFDEIASKNEESSLELYNSDYHERDTVDDTKSSVEKVKIEGMDSLKASTSDIQYEDQSIHQEVPQEDSSNLPTEHWQNQASHKTRLTDDELENTLNTSQVTKQKNITSHKTREYQLPGKDLLIERPAVDQTNEYRKINQNIAKLEQTFESFGVEAKVVKANLGPAVTKYEIEPAVGVKVSKIVSLTDDIALALAARDIRMEAPIPGKSLIGIEVPNSQISPVSFNEIVDASLDSKEILDVPLGRDVSGAISTADLSKMPHLLIAGSTGSGKSVGMNVIICSLLMKAKPEEVKFLMIDPKKVELTMYNEIPHLLAPVVTNPRKAAKALNQVVEEMERRYEKFAEVNVRNQESYNDYVDRTNQAENTGYEKMPKIVVFIDELADLMLVAGNEVENAIIRLAQMARAAGIHMIIATQRPSVDVITGIIKANIPSRLAFAVTSGTDSRTILDSNGAEKLLGKGDMLFQPISMNKPVRVQGAYISDDEVEKITNFIKAQRSSEYDDSMIITDEHMNQAEVSEDEYFEEAVELIKEQETVSISQLQRKFRIGYNRAARLIDDLEALGYIGPADGSKPRQVYINEN